MESIAPKRLSCGIVILNPQHELLLCHVTGQPQWDLPKGGAHAGEPPLQAALRETREETGLCLRDQPLHELGRLPYTNKKDLHLYAALMPRFDLAGLMCESHYCERWSGAQRPEMDDYAWCGYAEIGRRCTPKLAAVLLQRLDLPGLVARLSPPLPAWVALAA